LEKPQPFKKWVSIVAVIGFLAFLSYLFFFTDFTEVEVVIGGTNVPVYFLAFAAEIATVVFDALAWRAILNALGETIGFWRMFELTWVGIFIDTLIPGGWVGDLSKTYLVTVEDKVHGPKALAAIIIKDVLELFFILGSLLIGVVFLISLYSINGVLMTAVLITLLFLSLPLVLIIVLALNTRATEKLLNVVYKIVGKIKGEETGNSLTEKTKKQIQEFHDGLVLMRQNPRGIIKPAAYQITSGIFSVLILVFVFYALGTNIGFDKVLITNTVIGIIQGQGVVLAGFSQVVFSTLYTVLGIAPALSIASSLLEGFAGFWFRLVVAFGYFELIVAEKCVPFFCRKCGGWISWGKKSCDDPVLNDGRKGKTDEV
jgi:uncharacterized protein (TIRG00374 family)